MILDFCRLTRLLRGQRWRIFPFESPASHPQDLFHFIRHPPPCRGHSQNSLIRSSRSRLLPPVSSNTGAWWRDRAHRLSTRLVLPQCLEAIANDFALLSITDDELLARRRLGQTNLSVKPAQIGTSNATKPENLGVFEYAHLRAPLPKDLEGSEIFPPHPQQHPDSYFLMVRPPVLSDFETQRALTSGPIITAP